MLRGYGSRHPSHNIIILFEPSGFGLEDSKYKSQTALIGKNVHIHEMKYCSAIGGTN